MKGNYRNTIDDKGRIVIPSKFRNVLKDEGIVISLSYDSSLELRTNVEFKNWEKQLTEMDKLDNKIKKVKLLTLGNSFDVDFDKLGRILIPKSLISILKVKNGDFMQIIGQGNYLQIMHSNKWDGFIEDFLNKNN